MLSKTEKNEVYITKDELYKCENNAEFIKRDEKLSYIPKEMYMSTFISCVKYPSNFPSWKWLLFKFSLTHCFGELSW